MFVYKNEKDKSVTHMISDHLPEQYHNVLMWNINAEEIDFAEITGDELPPELEARAYAIAQQLSDENSPVDTVFLQEIPPYLVPSLIEQIEKYTTVSPGTFKHSFQSKADHTKDNLSNCGNLILTTRELRDSPMLDNTDDEKKIFTALTEAIKKSGGEEGQVQVAITRGESGKTNPQILLNVHANALAEETKDGRKKRLDLKTLYTFLQKHKDEAPYDNYEIIMAGDFNADFRKLRTDLCGKKINHAQNQELEANNYDHALPGTYLQETGEHSGVDAALGFHLAKTQIKPLYKANLVSELSDELQKKMKERFPEVEQEVKGTTTTKNEEESKAKLTGGPNEGVFANTLLKEYCSEKDFNFSIGKQGQNILETKEGNQIIYSKPSSGVEFTTKLPSNEEKRKELLNTMAEVVKRSGVKTVTIEIENMQDGPKKVALMDQMWLKAVKQGLTVKDYRPVNPAVLNEANVNVPDKKAEDKKDHTEEASISPSLK